MINNLGNLITNFIIIIFYIYQCYNFDRVKERG